MSLAIAGAVVVGGLAAYSADQQGDAAQSAANAQAAASDQSTEERRRQFDQIQKLLSPYVNAGSSALNSQRTLAGIGTGPDAQEKQRLAIERIQRGPQFTAMLQTGENRILQNASATGGLRGGNTQAALAQFSPQLLAQLIDSQYAKLGGIASMGENAAVMTGNAGLSTADGIADDLTQRGAAVAGGYLAQGKEQAGYANAFTQGLGAYTGLGGKF